MLSRCFGRIFVFVPLVWNCEGTRKSSALNLEEHASIYSSRSLIAKSADYIAEGESTELETARDRFTRGELTERAKVISEEIIDSEEHYSDASVAEQSYLASAFHDLWMIAIAIEMQILALPTWVVCVLVGLVALLFVFGCYQCCARWNKRPMEAQVNDEYNDKACLALLKHAKGNPRPSWELFFEYSNLDFGGPQIKKWKAMMEDDNVLGQIEKAFDSFRGENELLSKAALEELLASIDDGQVKCVAELRPSVEAIEYDYGWLWSAWGDIFPDAQHLDEASFEDLFKLLLTWRHHRAIDFMASQSSGGGDFAVQAKHSVRQIEKCLSKAASV